MAQRIPGRFRTFLRQELAQWLAEGLVDRTAVEALTRRYALDETETAGLALGALYVLAAGLVGAGAISLVAWHWEQMPAGLRLLLMGAAVVGAHVAGYRMWRITGRQPRVGHAISVLGTLLFGASIGLVAQIFHLSGVWYAFFGGWALGALAAGLALPSLPTLGFAFILGLYVWGPGFIYDHPAAAELVAWPGGAAALAIALRFRSRVLFLLAFLGLGVLLTLATLAPFEGNLFEFLPALVFWLAAAACALATRPPGGALHRFAGVAGALGRILFYVPAFVLSHAGAAELMDADHPWPRGWLTCILPLAVAALALLAVPGRAAARAPASPRLVALAVTAFAGVFTVGVLSLRGDLALTVLANVGMVAVAGLRMAQGLRERLRGPFWEGLAMAGLLATSRFFEIERMLWLKGVGFILCGLAVIAAGMAFERRVRAGREPDHG